jgi:membrane protein implicated in regulation of membrane protease activity
MDVLFQYLADAWKNWLVIGIAFMMIEGFTPGSFSFFLIGLGAFVTSVICYFFITIAANLTQQFLIFSVMSLFSLLLLRPRFLSFIQRNEIKLDGPGVFLGKRAKALTNLYRNGIETGKVLFEGTEWPALPSDDSPDISLGSVVEIARMEGLTLYVKLVKTEYKQGGYES